MSKASEHNEISINNIFENFISGQMVELDYAQRGNQDYLMIAFVSALAKFIILVKFKNIIVAELITKIL